MHYLWYRPSLGFQFPIIQSKFFLEFLIDSPTQTKNFHINSIEIYHIIIIQYNIKEDQRNPNQSHKP